MDKHIIQEILEDAGYECRSYSGRGMGNQYCLGIVLEQDQSVGHLFRDVLITVVELMDADAHDIVIYQLPEPFASMKTDSLGRGTIVYFPGVEYVDEDDEESNEDYE